MEKARRGTKRVVVETELVKEEYNERTVTGAFSELKTSLALPRQGIPREQALSMLQNVSPCVPWVVFVLSPPVVLSCTSRPSTPRLDGRQ